MAIVTMTKWITMNKGHAIHFQFRWQRAPRFNNTVGPTPALRKQLP